MMDSITNIPEQLPFILGRIEGKLELVLLRLDHKDAELADRFCKAEDRLSHLEAKSSRMWGIGSGLVAAASLIMMALKYAFGVHI
jgi:hypothetical protein